MNNTATIEKPDTLSLQSEEDYKKDQGITQSKYAERRGISRQAIHKHVKNGVITLLPNGMIDPEAADLELEDKLNPANGGQQSLPLNGNGALYEEKRKREKVQRMLLELDLKVKTGENINRKKAEGAFSNKITAVVRRLQKISKRISPAVAKESDRVKCEEIILNEIKEAVEEFGPQITAD